MSRIKIEAIVDRLLSDLNDRSGYDLDVDDDVLEEWKTEWVNIIEEALNEQNHG